MATVRQRQLKLPTVLLALAMVFGTAAGVRAATATWNPNTEPDLAGYKLSYGTQSGVHTVVIDVGKVTTYQFNPPGGQRYYVVVQAYNTAGQLSDKSAEVVVDVPASQPGVPGVPAPTQPGAPPTQPPTPVPTQPPVAVPAPPPTPAPTQPTPPGPAAPAAPTPLRLVQPPNQTTRVNTSVVLAVSASHLESKPFSFSATGLPPGLSLNSESGVISGIPHTIGFYRAAVTVSDGAFSATGDFTWSIVDTLPPGAGSTNHPPAMDQPENQKSPVDWPVRLALSARDPEGQPLTFSATGLPPGLSLDSSSGVVSGTATTLGSYHVWVTVSDGEMSTVRGFTWAVVKMTQEELNSLNSETGSSSNSVGTSEPDADAVKDLQPVEDYVGVSGDFDGDGRKDLATYRLSSGEWRIWTSSSNFATATVMAWGEAGDRPVAADYNGDRVTDLGVYRPSTGTWHLWLSGTHTPLALHWGGPEDTPVALDHDADGKADLALIRGGGYEILLSSTNYLKSVRIY